MAGLPSSGLAKLFLGLAIPVVAAALALSAPAQAQNPIIIKFSHVVANDTPKG
ncbi:MAG: C4-dicarboxylate ABC transporter, partial [Hyphomicrobiaceae bacterium]